MIISQTEVSVDIQVFQENIESKLMQVSLFEWHLFLMYNPKVYVFATDF